MEDIFKIIKQKGKTKVTKLSDMKDFYKSIPENIKKKNPTIYSVDFVDENEISYAITKINPGRIGKEFYMTKGHYHIKLTSEVYYHMSGEGILLIKLGEHKKKIIMKKGVFHYIPAGWGHRTINVGEKPLIFLSIYQNDAGHDYEKVKREGL